MKEYVMDFNDIISRENDLIPVGTVVKVRMALKKGGYGEEGILTKSQKTGVLYLDSLLTVIEGIYSLRRIYQRFGVTGGDAGNKWVQKSLQQLRSILESAHNILPTDTSEKAREKRRIKSYQDFEKLEFLIKVGIEKPHDSRFPPENCVQSIMTPDRPEFAKYFACIDPPPESNFQGNPYKPFNEKANWPL